MRFARMLSFLSAGTKENTFDFETYMMQLQAYYDAGRPQEAEETEEE